jgi:Zn-dependent protease with chaperone function
MAVRLQLKLGIVAEQDRLDDSPDTLVVVEPSVGSVARSKGNLYLLVTSRVVTRHALEATRLAGWLQRAFLFVLAPVAASFTHLLLSPNREFNADRAAAEICESPHGLAEGLLRLEDAGSLVEFRASPATEPLYTVNPFLETGLAAMFVTHPPLGERVRRLRALDPAWRDRLRAA